MAYIKANFKLTKTSSTNIFVEEVKLNTKYSSSFKFEFADRPLKYHPIIIKYLDSLKRNLKSSDRINIELCDKDLAVYYDLKSSRFWFNKVYLESTAEDQCTNILYDNSLDPEAFASQFVKNNVNLKEIDKVNKFIGACPELSANILRLEAR